MSPEQGLLVMEFVGEQDGGPVIAGGLAAASQLLQTAASHTSRSDTLLHILICDRTPAIFMTPQPGVFLGKLGINCEVPSFHARPLLQPESWVSSGLWKGVPRLGSVARSGLWNYRPMSCPRGERAVATCTTTCLLGPDSQVHWGSFHERGPRSGEAGKWGGEETTKLSLCFLHRLFLTTAVAR